MTAATRRGHQVWARCEPVVSRTPDDVSPAQTTYGYQTGWWRELDPDCDLTPEAWAGENRLFAMVTKEFYGLLLDGTEIVEEQTEYVICSDSADPAGTELCAWYRYRTVEEGVGVDSGDPHLQTLACAAELADVTEWNAHVADFEDDTWAQLDDGN